MKRMIVSWMLVLAFLLTTGCGKTKENLTEESTVSIIEATAAETKPETTEDIFNADRMEPPPVADDLAETTAATEPTQVPKSMVEPKPTEITPPDSEALIVPPETPEDGLGWG